jgi:hypothetical protein
MAKKEKRTDGAASLGNPGFKSPMDVPSTSKNETWDKPFATPSFDSARDPLGILPPGGSAPKTSSKRRGGD